MKDMETHDDVIREKQLPRVGQTVRSKKYRTLWRVMEKREVWQSIADDPSTDKSRLTPAIYLSYWKIKKGVLPGIGKMMGYAYTIYDSTFESNREFLASLGIALWLLGIFLRGSGAYFRRTASFFRSNIFWPFLISNLYHTILLVHYQSVN